MERVISESEIVSLRTMANAVIGLTDDLTKLNQQKRHFEGSFNSIGLSFMYNPDDLYDVSKDVIIDLQLGSNDPLFAEWREFEKKAIEAINKRIEDKRKSLSEIKEHIKRMS